METPWDCIVVGAGAAGLSAALVLGRARRRTLVVDSAGQSNRAAEGIGGLLGHDGQPPSAFYAAGRAELAAYPSVELRHGEVADGERSDRGFVLALADGSRQAARRVLLATGMDYRFPELPGIAERWGRSVFHCPFCHGWEHRDEPLGVLDPGARGVERALLLRLWSDDVTLFTDGPAELEPADAGRLAEAGVEVDERPVCALHGADATLTAVAFADGDARPCRGLLVPVSLHQRSALAAQLGAALAAAGPVVADAVEVDSTFETSVPGLYAAGDASTQMPSVAGAIASGHGAAAAIVHGLLADVYGAVGAAAEDPNLSRELQAGAGHDEPERFWEERYRSQERVWSGRPNAVLVEVVGSLPAGRALDLGCGEGADAVWLAGRGWHVTAVDVSATALERTAAHAKEAGVERRIELQQHDLGRSFPSGAFDLVSAQYLQSPVALPRERVLRAAAGAVAAGGLLLVVDHASVPPWSRHAHAGRHAHASRSFPTPEQVLAGLRLEPEVWETERLGAPERVASGPDGQSATVRDTVIGVRRRAH